MRLRRLCLVLGGCSLLLPSQALAAGHRADHSVAAQLAAAVTLIVVTAPLLWLRRVVAVRDLRDGAGNLIATGSMIPRSKLKEFKAGADYVGVRGYPFRALLIGADNRWSTSKFQALLWTYAVIYGVIALMVAKALGAPSGFNALATMPSNDWDVYLILLGGPFAALVLAKASTSAKVDQGTIQKTTAPTSTLNPFVGLGQVLANDQGSADLGDTQYFAFTLVVLAYFLVTLGSDLSKGFPELPTILVGLTSVSAATYVAKKAAEGSTPSLSSVIPSKVKNGGAVEVWGVNIVIPAATTPAPPEWTPVATVDGLLTPSVAVLSHTGSTDHLRITLPTLTIPAGSIPKGSDSIITKLTVYTALGQAAGTLELHVTP